MKARLRRVIFVIRTGHGTTQESILRSFRGMTQNWDKMASLMNTLLLKIQVQFKISTASWLNSICCNLTEESNSTHALFFLSRTGSLKACGKEIIRQVNQCFNQLICLYFRVEDEGIGLTAACICSLQLVYMEWKRNVQGTNRSGIRKSVLYRIKERFQFILFHLGLQNY